MILEIRAENFFAFSGKIEISANADMRIKRFASNTVREAGYDIVKALAIYGSNNVGKTFALRILEFITGILQHKPAPANINIFSKDDTCRLGVSFTFKGEAYSYDIHYRIPSAPNRNGTFVYERFSKLITDSYGNECDREIFVRDAVNKRYGFTGNAELSDLLESVSNDNILIYTANSEKYPELEKCKSILTGFAENILIIDMNNVPISLTLEIIKRGKSDPRYDMTVELIKTADLEIEDFKFVKRSIPFAKSEQPVQEAATRAAINAAEELFGLTSVHNGIDLPSMAFDSTGTKKVIAVAGYIADALIGGKTLIVDELDSSLHFKLTRAIIAIFNNEANKRAQLIFTAHDAMLLDCKKLLRKAQIWFADKDENGVYMYPLSDFTAEHDNVRSDSDMTELYKRGVFGAVPEPDLISALLTAEDKEDKDE